MSRTAKNERYRMASTLREGMEVQRADDSWTAVTQHWYITGPLRVVSVTLADGSRHSFAPRDQVFSRMPVVPVAQGEEGPGA